MGPESQPAPRVRVAPISPKGSGRGSTNNCNPFHADFYETCKPKKNNIAVVESNVLKGSTYFQTFETSCIYKFVKKLYISNLKKKFIISILKEYFILWSSYAIGARFFACIHPRILLSSSFPMRDVSEMANYYCVSKTY